MKSVFSLLILLTCSFSVNAIELSIASWNLKDYGGKFGGTSKARSPEINQAILDNISPYDLVLFQELSNLSEEQPDRSVFFENNLCIANVYWCDSTSMEGMGWRTKESIGVLLKLAKMEELKDIPVLKSIKDSRLRRHFARLDINIQSNEWLILYTAHTSPSNGAYKELRAIEQLITSDFNEFKSHGNNYIYHVLLVGDLNADCAGGKSKYTKKDGLEPNLSFSTPWVSTPYVDDPSIQTGKLRHYLSITSNQRTNFAKKSACSYDRLITSPSLYYRLLSMNIVGEGLKGLWENEYFWTRMPVTVPTISGDKKTDMPLSDHRLLSFKFTFPIIKCDLQSNNAFRITGRDFPSNKHTILFVDQSGNIGEPRSFNGPSLDDNLNENLKYVYVDLDNNNNFDENIDVWSECK